MIVQRQDELTRFQIKDEGSVQLDVLNPVSLATPENVIGWNDC